MPKFNVRMTEYYEFKNVEAANEEEAKQEEVKQEKTRRQRYDSKLKAANISGIDHKRRAGQQKQAKKGA